VLKFSNDRIADKLKDWPAAERKAGEFRQNCKFSDLLKESIVVDTLISSKTKDVVIGEGRPFVIIGERINPTGRKLLAAEMKVGNYERVKVDAIAQVEAGALMLDVNAGIPLADEPKILAEAIELVQSATDAPVSIDSSVVAALERGLQVAKGKPLLNSITGEDERLEALLPLVKRYGCAFIGISNDETGISEDPDVRFSMAKKIVERAADYGIPRSDILIDPLVMPIGAMASAGKSVFKILNRCRDELGVNTCCGASNVSFGLPNRPALNGTFLAMAIANGLTSAITNPIETEIKQAVMAANVFMGSDENCLNWIEANRGPTADVAEGEAGGRRERRQRRARRR